MSKFKLGQIVVTRNCMNYAQENQIDLLTLVERHASGDDGDLDPEDKHRNRQALVDGSRIFSSYGAGDKRVWVITEADRSSTCVLKPEDY